MKVLGLIAAAVVTALACPASAFEISSPAVGADGELPDPHAIPHTTSAATTRLETPFAPGNRRPGPGTPLVTNSP